MDLLKIHALKIRKFGNNDPINKNITISDIVFFGCNFADRLSCEINLIRIKTSARPPIFDVSQRIKNQGGGADVSSNFN